MHREWGSLGVSHFPVLSSVQQFSVTEPFTCTGKSGVMAALNLVQKRASFCTFTR